MNTENNTVVPENQESNEPQYSEVELRALDMGWRPKEEFSGDEADFVDAKEFIGRKPLYDKIASTTKQLKNVTQAVEALKEHFGKVQETEYNKALKALKEQRKQALVEGDADKFEQLDDDIKSTEREVDELREASSKPIVKEEPTIHPEFANWQNKNQWYGSVRYMREFADELGGKLANTMTPSEVLKEVEKAVRKEFPHKFTNPNKNDAPDVTSAKNGGRANKSESIEMTADEVRIMNTLVRGGHINKEDYISQLKAVKGIK